MNFFKHLFRLRSAVFSVALSMFWSISAFAQVEIIQSFDAGTTLPAGWVQNGGYTVSATLSCAGNTIRDNLYTSSATGFLQSPTQAAVSNGTDVTVAFDYKVYNFSSPNAATTGDWGVFRVEYSLDGGSTWIYVDSISQVNHTPTSDCTTKNYTIPGANVPSGSGFTMRWIATWRTGDYYLAFDNVSITQVVTSVPTCSQLTSPANGATNVLQYATISWNQATGQPLGYKLSVGTTSGGTDVLNNVNVGNVLSYSFTSLLEGETEYFVTVKPFNSFGDATGCTETSFTTCPSVNTFSENFDSYGTGNIVPTCWGRLVGGTGSMTISSTTPASGTRNIYQYSSSPSNPTVVALPVVKNLDDGTHWLNIKFRVSSGSGLLEAGYLVAPYTINDFVSVQSIVITNTTYGPVTTIIYPTTVPANAVMAIRNAGNTTASHYWDDVVYSAIPTCPNPTALINTALAGTSASFSWNEVGSATQWFTQHGPTGFTLGTGVNSVANTNSNFSVSGLTANTTYQIYVRSFCSVGDTSGWTGPLSFTTTCDPFTTFFEDFEAYATGSIVPSCWGRIISGSGSQTISSTTPASGVRNIYQYSSGTANSTIVVFPTMTNVNAGTHQLLVKFRSGSATTAAQMEFGYVLPPYTSAASFQSLQSFSFANTAYGPETIFNVPTSVPADARLALRNPGLSTTSVYWDDASWVAIPTCPKPVSPATASVTETSAALSWTPQGSETNWVVEYGAPGFTLGTGTSLAASTNTNFPLTGLTSNTSYQWYVRAACSPTDSSEWTSPVTFKTDCAIATTVNEDFDSYATGSANPLPDCWTRTVVTGSAYLSTTYRTSLPNGMYMYCATTASNVAIAALPRLSNAGAGTHRLKFKARAGSTTVFTSIRIGHMTNPLDSTTFVQDTIIYNIDATFTEYIAELGTAPGTAEYIAFRSPNAAQSIYIDDVIWELIPTCPDITNLVVNNFGSDNVTFSWTGVAGGTDYNYEIGTPGFIPGTGAALFFNGVTTTGTTVTGLTANTAYQVYVQSNCSGPRGAWVGGNTFTTQCTPVTTYAINFDGLPTGSANPLPPCMARVLGGTASSYITTGSGMSPPNRLYTYCAAAAPNVSITVLPPVSNAGAGTHRLRLTAQATSITIPFSRYVVGYMTNPADSLSFVGTDTVSLTTTSPEVSIFQLGTAPGSALHLAIRNLNQTRTIYFDDIYWEPTPLCYEVDGSQASSLTTNSAVISWTDLTGTAQSYDWEVGPDGFDPGTSTATDSGNSTGAQDLASGLSPNTKYNIYVRTQCGPGQLGVWERGTDFTTLCAPITSFSENFDSYATGSIVPECWGRLISGTGSQTITSTTPASGTRNIYQYSSSSANSTIVVLPNVSNLAAETHQLSAKFRVTTSTGIHPLNIGYVTDVANPASFVSVQDLVISNTTYGPVTTIYFPSTVPSGAVMAIRNPGQSTTSFYWDDVAWEPLPACPTPGNFQASLICADGVSLSWNQVGSSTSWDIYNQTTATPVPTGLTTPTVAGHTSMSYTATGLAPGSTQYYWVRSGCGSNWIGPVTVAIPTITPLPHLQNFGTGTTLPANWANVTSTWVVGSTHGNPGSGLTANCYASLATRTIRTPFFGPITAGQGLVFDTRVLNYYSTTTAPPSTNPGPGYGSFTISISTDCGATFTPIATYADEILATSSTEWFNKVIDLSPYVGNSVAFRLTGSRLIGDWSVDVDNFQIAEICTGTPVAGTTSTGLPLVCSGSNFTVNLTGQSSASGVGIQWESSLDNSTWDPIVGATTASLTTSTTTPVYYRAVVTCETSNQSATSNVTSVGINTDLCECICNSSAISLDDTKFDTISIGGTTFGSNPSTCESLTKRCDSGVVLPLGGTVNIRLVNGSCSGNHINARAAAFADWNADGDFDDADETILASTATTGLGSLPAFDIVVPATAVLGNVMMRFIIREGGIAPSSCGTYSYGETEDIEVMIEEPVVPCAVRATGMKALVQSLDEVYAVWEGGDPYQNTIQLSYRLKNSTTWINRTTSADAELPNNSLAIRPVGGFAPDTLYEVRVRFRCPNLAWTPYSDTAVFSTYLLNNPTDCRPTSKVGFAYLKANGQWLGNKVLVLTDKRGGGSATAKPYFVSWRPLSNPTWLSRTQAFPKYNVIALTPNTEYAYRWRTWCDATARWSAFVTDTFTTLPAPPVPLNGNSASRNELDETVAMGSVFVFPNPADDFVNIFFENGEIPEFVRVFDTQGRQVATMTPASDLERLDISTFAPGTYMIQVIQSDQRVVTEKFVKF